MSSPGPVERVPLKVVPMFIEDQSVQLPPDPAAPPPAADVPRAPRPWLGALSVALALVAATVQVVAIVGATAQDFELGIVLAFLAVILAVAAVGVGIAAVVVKRGRHAGIAGILLGMLANPLVLLAILRFVDGVQG